MKIGCHSEDSDESEDEESGAHRRYAENLRLRLSPQGGESAMADRMTGYLTQIMRETL